MGRGVVSELLQFPGKTYFSPEQTRFMGEAFDLVRQYAQNTGRCGLETAEARELIAHHILERAATGELDPAKLAEYAIALVSM
jgi:hypothetical protein